MKQLYANKWYWYLGALLCVGLSVYWFVTFTSSHNNVDLFIGIVTLGIAGSAVWRALHPTVEQEPSDSTRS
jgi:hypothetical protein